MPPMSPFFAGSELRGKLRGDFSEECRRDHEHTVQQLRSEKVHLLYENLWQPVVLSVVVAGLLVITLWPVVPAATLLGWLGALSLVSLLRLGLAHCYARLPKEQRQHPRWLWRFAIGTLVVGCVWGAGSFLLFTPDHYGQLAALCIVFSGIIAGGVTTLSTIWWVAACFSVPIILPLLAQFFWMGTTLSMLLGTILTLFLGLVLLTSRRLNRIIHANIYLRVSMAAREVLLRESENRYRSIFQHSPLGVLHFNRKGRITDCNAKLLDVLGVARAQVIGYNLLNDAANPAVGRAVGKMLRGGTGYYEGTYTLPDASEGTPLRAFFNVVHSDGHQQVGGIAIVEDFTQRKRQEAIIYRQAYYDVLTDLPNRRHFIEGVQALWQQTPPSRGMLMFLDLDRFKLINDTLGHAAGDDLLVQVATRLQGCLRPDDQVARLSGDEFVLLALFDADADESGIETSGIEEQAAAYAARVERALGAEYCLEGQRVSVTPSIGYTCLDTRTGDHEEALKQADIAMYRAKTAGRNQVCCYRPAMREAFQQSAARYTSPEAVQGLQSDQPAFTATLACQKALE
jgi:diguanylate cyclase (GGDEF)-like protein/PAS domain S-box-containing protein